VEKSIMFLNWRDIVEPHDFVPGRLNTAGRNKAIGECSGRKLRRVLKEAVTKELFQAGHQAVSRMIVS
jgi:hypothetical protein